MLGKIFKPLEISILDTVERFTAFVALVLIGAICSAFVAYYVATIIQEQRTEYYNQPFVLERYPAKDKVEEGIQ